MQLITKVNPSSPNFKLSQKDTIMLVGSCFSTEIGEKLKAAKFHTLINPFGTLFHPIAIENSLTRIYTSQYYTVEEIFNYKDLYFSWDHSTLFSKPKLSQTINLINENLEKANEHFQKTKIFIFTLGTAWVYELSKANLVVSNCHKVPQSQFEKYLLSTAEIYKSLKNITDICLDRNPEARIIYTISPVRHWKDGAHDNQLSKSSLFLGLEKIIEDYQDSVYYFPSYEIVMDELRDYRFFKQDLIHPNQIAVEYLWEVFSDLFFSEGTQKLNKEIESVNRAVSHRALNPQSLAHRKFLYDTLKKIEKISPELPKDSFREEIQILKEKIHYAS